MTKTEEMGQRSEKGIWPLRPDPECHYLRFLPSTESALALTLALSAAVR
jgi:hypothetical protein